MTDKIEVPRELLEELRDCAELCADDVRAHDLGEDSAETHFRQVGRACDALLREAAKEAVTPEYNGWYCAQCQCGVDPSEVTYNETHAACGRRITDDHPPADHTDNEGEPLPSKTDDLEAMRRDAELLDWLEERVKESGSRGVSFDYVRFIEDGYVVEKGFRFMRRHYLGGRHPTIRAAIAAEKREGE